MKMPSIEKKLFHSPMLAFHRQFPTLSDDTAHNKEIFSSFKMLACVKYFTLDYM